MTKTRLQKILSVLVKIAMVLAVVAAVLIGMLKMAERSPDSLRLGLQDYLTKTAGNPAEIGSMEDIQLFPKIYFRLKDILIRDKNDRNRALVRADSAYISMNFWKSFFGIRNYDAVEIKNLQIATGYIFPQKIALDYVGISDPLNSTAPPYFIFDGIYNNRPLLITAAMTRYGTKENFSYDFAREFPVTFKLGSTEANAMFKRDLTHVDFAQITLVNGKQEALLSAPDMSFNPVHIPLKGKISGVPMTGSLNKSGDIYTLTITPEKADKASLKQINEFLKNVEKDFGIDEKPKNMVVVVKTDAEAASSAKEVSKE